ncbi:type I-E CRISPR-associated protein Cas6/Cse3/CasE [Actinocrinis puniceicyclus]|uniref:Type I-E CRISPR-associated protein Cas6/Cse3/CasE n=1 Tax=Actinocrinis puniceicyclus TaxID=977794 RepID=A0A8J7WTD2_9ACTN|nr:type I-E CRISPR-associated protein Cas6/Cse3/CasE [Actinocrinis puniceicyclus]MBS2965657.1 type I-E CRISPR-associated protein Cas6/Cse3/CasE [Actinocrinis puniceicyclus]
MPYLSKIRINPLRRKGRDLLSNPHIAHAMISGGIAEQPVTQRILWRIDAPNPRQPDLLVLTSSKPDWSHIVEQAGWPYAEGEHFLIRDYEPLLRHIAVGREYAFKLTANPVQNTINPLKPSGQQREQRAKGQTRAFRVPHTTSAHQTEWLLGKLPNLGFTIPQLTFGPPVPGGETDDSGDTRNPTPTAPIVRDVLVTAGERLNFAKNSTRTGPRVSLVTATYEGRLRVTDADVLRERLLGGVGPAKAYGCGLLTLAPLAADRHA